MCFVYFVYFVVLTVLEPMSGAYVEQLIIVFFNFTENNRHWNIILINSDRRQITDPMNDFNDNSIMMEKILERTSRYIGNLVIVDEIIATDSANKYYDSAVKLDFSINFFFYCKY